MEKIIEQSIECQDVMSYMNDVLVNEFPISELTPDYLILSILDNTRCHANIILDNVFMSDTMECLRNECVNNIKSLKTSMVGEKGKTFNQELSAIIDLGLSEMRKQGIENLGTEHLLMAIVSKANKGTDSYNLLDKYGLNYSHIYDKCEDFIESQPRTQKPVDKSFVNNNHQNNKIPLKSEVNSRNVVSNGNTPFINKYTTNLNEEIYNGKYDRLIGREEILNNIIKVLSRRKKNNVILVGKEGVGKTSIGRRLAEMIEEGNVPDILENKKVLMLDIMALVSGTHLRGMFEERVDNLFKELKANPNYILFIDDMQNVVKNSGKDKDTDLSDMLGNILADGEVRVVGTISFKNYRNGIENNSVLSTKLQKIIVEPSTKEETFEILKQNKTYYENFHHVKFSDECLYKAITLAKRYITNNNLPDSAIDVLDLTGASMSLNDKKSNPLKSYRAKLAELDDKKKKAMNNGDFEKLDEYYRIESKIMKDINDKQREMDNDDSTWLVATEENIADTVSSMTNIPVSKLKAADRTSILNIAETLKKDVIGQDEAIEEISKAIKRARAGFSDNNKCINILAIGPSGVGKTILAKKIAENIYGDERALVRFDMSEYQDKTSVNKLIGANAGYVGYENGGLLTEAIKNKPYCVLLFDEIEKADESIYNLFLQLFDEGRLTDNNGVTVNFKNVIVIMTSNVGARQASEVGAGLGFINNSEATKKSIVEKAIKNKFNPEFINRIDKIIHFNYLSEDNLKTISKIELDRVCKRVKENGVSIEYTDDVINYIYERAIVDKEYGARPIMRIIQDNISDKVVDLVLSTNKKKNKYKVSVDENGEIVAKTC